MVGPCRLLMQGWGWGVCALGSPIRLPIYRGKENGAGAESRKVASRPRTKGGSFSRAVICGWDCSSKSSLVRRGETDAGKPERSRTCPGAAGFHEVEVHTNAKVGSMWMRRATRPASSHPAPGV